MTHTTDPVTARIAADPTEATLVRVADRWVLTMRRQLRHPVERVWPMLVEPDRLARWSPVVPDRALDSIGRATARENPSQESNDAEVLVADAPRELVHRWGDHLLRWHLEPAGNGSVLTLEHTFDVRAESSEYGAGWHLCLAVLGTVLDGHDVERVTGAKSAAYGWPELRDTYEAELG